MIYTITLNPAIDYFITVSDQPLIDTEVNRALKEKFQVGGKGLNVSTMLDKLDIPSVAIALVGGFTGEYIKECLSESNNISLKAIEASGINRINVKVYNGDNTICINGNGVSATTQTKTDLLNALEGITNNDWVLICGSLVENIDYEFIGELVEVIHSKQARLVMDMESLTLDLLEKYKPYLVKPNLYEFRMLMGDDSITVDTISPYLNDLLNIGVESVLVSLGPDGAILSTPKTKYRLRHKPINAVNKIGSGDAMLATYVGMLSQDKHIGGALAWAGAAGVAMATTREEVTYQMIKESLSLLEVYEVKS